jgi:hypothetical protein
VSTELTFSIRPAQSPDLPTIAHIEALTATTHPSTILAYPNNPTGVIPTILPKLQSRFTQPNYHFLVAVSNTEEILGVLIWKFGHSEKSVDRDLGKQESKDEVAALAAKVFKHYDAELKMAQEPLGISSDLYGTSPPFSIRDI